MSQEDQLSDNLEDSQTAARILIRNSVFYFGADTIIKLLGFIFNILVVRELGDTRFGLYNTVLAYVGIFSIIGDLGMTQYAKREIARGRKLADDLFWNLVVIRLILAIIATIFITSSAAFVVNYPSEIVAGIFIACLGLWAHAFFGPVDIILNGRERIDYSAILGIIIQAFFIGMGAVVLRNGYSFHTLIVASYIGVPFAAIFGAVVVRRLKLATFKFKVTPSEWLPILKFSIPFALITFTLLVGKDIDTVLLSLWRTPDEVGWYRAAYNLIFKLLFIRGALLSTLTPQMSRYYGVSKNRVGQTFNTSFKILWAFSLPIAVGVAILAEPIIIFLYTDEYIKSAEVLAILIWSLPFLNLSSLCGSVTTATDKEKHAAKVYTASAMLNLGVNLVAIPIWGYLGAAIATNITELVALLLFYSLLHAEFPLTDLTNTLVKPVIASLIMGGVILVLQSWSLLAVILIGVVVYSVTLLALNPFSNVERLILEGFLTGLRARFARK